MSRPEKAGFSALSIVLCALLLLMAWCALFSWPWLLAAVPGALLLVLGGAALWRRRELRRLNRWIDDRCEGCGYSLRGLGRSGRCPECGKNFKGLGVDARGVPA